MKLIFFNLIVTFLYIIFFDLSRNSYLLLLLYVLLSILIVTLFLNFKKILLNFVEILNISLASIISFFLFLEIIFFFKPSIVPTNITIFIDRDKEFYNDKVEFSKKLPYVKFKPNTEIRIRHYRGGPKDFEYTWNTDNFGFKNYKNINLDDVNVLMLGDSFTEGFGVKISDTISNQIAGNSSFLPYNLGVQGYSISQMRAVYQKYKKNFRYNFVILNYLAGTYSREQIIENQLKNNDEIIGAGGIFDVATASVNDEVRNSAFFISSALWTSTKFLRKNIARKIKGIEYDDKRMNIYPGIKFDIENKDYNNFSNNSFSKFLSEIIKIKEISKSDNTQMIFVYYINRSMAYYQKATGKFLPNKVFYERDAIQEFCKKNNIHFLDISKDLIDYVIQLKTNDNENYNSLPFLKRDAHLSPVGNSIVANSIINKLRKIEK